MVSSLITTNVKILEKNNKVSQLYAHLTIFQLFLFKKVSHYF